MKPVLEMQANQTGRDFVCGDIHGRWDLLETELAAHGFDPDRDRVMCVGDLVDRGEASARFAHYLSQPWFFSIMGNHEQLAIKAIRTGEFKDMSPWLANGGGWIMKINPDKHPAVADALSTLPLTITLQGYGDLPVVLAHAELPEPNWPAARERLSQVDETHLVSGHPDLRTLLWSRKRFDDDDATPVSGALHVFYGHNIVEAVSRRANTSYIDIGSASTGKLAVLDVGEYLHTLQP